MLRPTIELKPRASAHASRIILFVLTAIAIAHQGSAQDTPLISGGVGFFTSTDAGSTSNYPIAEPLLAGLRLANTFSSSRVQRSSSSSHPRAPARPVITTATLSESPISQVTILHRATLLL